MTGDQPGQPGQPVVTSRPGAGLPRTAWGCWVERDWALWYRLQAVHEMGSRGAGPRTGH